MKLASVECMLLYQDQVDVCKHVIYYCVQMKRDIEHMTNAQHAAKWVCVWITIYSDLTSKCSN